MSSVLVTGATGFVGFNLVQTLVARGDRVRCLVRSVERAAPLCELGAELVQGDLHEADKLSAAVANVETVFHLAGLTESFRTEELFRVNQAGTASLLAACAASHTPPVVVLVSSIAAAGPAARGQVRTEADPPAPVSNYGRSKLAAEEAAERFSERVPITIVRPGLVFGPHDRVMLAAFRAIRLTRSHVTPGWPPPPLSWIHVADLVEILIRAAQGGARLPAAGQGSPGQGRYFAVCPEHPSWAEFGRLARPLLSRPFALLLSVPSPLAWCAAGTSECVARLRGRAHRLNFDKIREALVESWACSGEAVRQELGFTPPKPLAERLQETIAWYQNEGLLKDGFFRLV